MTLFRSTRQFFLLPAVGIVWNDEAAYLNISFLCFGIVLLLARFESESEPN